MNQTEIITQALAQLDGVGSVTRGWPGQTAQLPCIAIALEEQAPADIRDNAAYLTKTTYRLRVFAATPAACDALLAPITQVMQAQGYTRLRTLEAGGEDAQLQITFYRLI